MELWGYGLYDQNFGVNQIKKDSFLLAFSAKWLGEKKIFYFDQSNKKNLADDKALAKKLWKLMNEADILLTQNGISFDERVANTRFEVHGLGSPGCSKHLDTKRLAKKKFKLPSYSLEYMAKLFCKKHKKLKHSKFPGQELWTECLAKNKKAWKEMRRYNINDVLVLEELYLAIAHWGTGIDFNVYREKPLFLCQCGSDKLVKWGFYHTNAGKFQRYSCSDCGAWVRSKAHNLLTAAKKLTLKGPG